MPYFNGLVWSDPITGGENVYPREVEEALYLRPEVEECAVIGLPDKEWGERVAAFIVPRQGHSVVPEDPFVSLQGAQGVCRGERTPQEPCRKNPETGGQEAVSHRGRTAQAGKTSVSERSRKAAKALNNAANTARKHKKNRR